ncbi:uncharacterized protein LOC134825552 [Bolinopsis microptera]|uniref:uncharacterized protein LOC134825552 n=1 Tax=Bolinopsis microptera TaxID=2820187 RepID=UPI00307AAA0D
MSGLNIALFFIVSSLVTSESDAWFHKPRCPPRDPKCNSYMGRDVSKRHIVSFQDMNHLGPTVPPLGDLAPDRIIYNNTNRRLRHSKRARHDIRYRSRLQRYRDRFNS